jgi:hypothetical protein
MKVPTKLSSREALERFGWIPFAFVIGAVLIASVAGIAWNSSPYYGRNDSPIAAKSSDTGTVPVARGTFTANVPLAPNRVVIPKLKATAPVVSVATGPDRELEIPEDPKQVGWWSPGARPGATKGTAVLAGHINFRGKTGTFASIGKLRPGDAVEVYGKYNAGARKVAFRVTAVRTYHKTSLPYREIFDQSSVGRMALVTCGGPFDASTGNYLDNIVVYAVPVGSSAA